VSRRPASREAGITDLTRNVKFTLAYDGTRYVGWQRQAEGVSVQGLLEEALARFEGQPVTVHGAGRTDAGVHALGQVATAQVSGGHAAPELLRGLNALLPRDVRVTQVEEVAADFHARFSASSKAYRYAIRNAPIVSPFEYPFVWHVTDRVDVAAMQAAAATLMGEHDFACFRSAGTKIRNTTRTVTESRIDAVEGLITYHVTANGFLHHMVRAIAGTLVDVGRRRRPPESLPALLDGGLRAEAGPTAPPQGLFLVSVTYD